MGTGHSLNSVGGSTVFLDGVPVDGVRNIYVSNPFSNTESTMSDREVEVTDESRTDRETIDTNPSESGKWVSGLVALLGLWLVLQVFLLEPIAGNFWSDVIIGVALIALGGYNYYRRANENLGSVAASAFVALLGLLLIVVPFVLGSTDPAGGVETDTEFWNDVIVGALTFLLGAYSAYEARDTDVARPAART